MARKSLGRGLDALIGSASGEGDRIAEIGIDEIKPNPRQPRQNFEQGLIAEMAESIREFGIVQPVIVRAVGTEYELIAGERRLRAAKEAGLKKIPAIIRDTKESDSLEMALIENLHRADLNGIEEATAYRTLIEEFGMTHEELARRIGKSRTSVTNALRLLLLPEKVRDALMSGAITTGHARALLGLQGNSELQVRLAERIAEEGISVRKTEELVRAYLTGRAGKKTGRTPLPDEALALLGDVESCLGTSATCVIGKRKGKLLIEFRNLDELRRIVGVLKRGAERPPYPPGSGVEAPEGTHGSG